MTVHRWAVGLTLVNFALLLFALLYFLPQPKPMEAAGVAPVLRARALELLGEDGKIRAKINVESDGTVVFRLTDQKGNIRMKLGASEEGSGFLLLNDATEPGIHMLAESTGTTLTLTAKDGQQQVLVP